MNGLVSRMISSRFNPLNFRRLNRKFGKGVMHVEQLWETLSVDEPYLVDLVVFRRESSEDAPEVAGFWSGEELFRTEFLREEWGTLFRAHVPFHAGGDDLRVVRIDLDTAVADFLLEHARHNVIVAALGGLVLVALSLYSVWAMRKRVR